MNITLLNTNYRVIDTKEKITIADSFVVRKNKIGQGNGEAKLYVGQDNEELRKFFGNVGFSISCFLLKEDLLKYLEETKPEYINPEQPYNYSQQLPNLWQERKANVDTLPNEIEFEISEQTQIDGPRVYVNSTGVAYKLIRELSLPNITYISIVKLYDENRNCSYYFRLFADYFGEVEHPYTSNRIQSEIDKIDDIAEKTILSRSRVGQGKYREQLLELCPICPITLVTDDRLLIASHIKPWSKSNNQEKIDPYNGFMLTPTVDYLFDRGFLSFTDDKKSILSPFLSKVTYAKLGMSDSKTYPYLPLEGRSVYLDYHRNEILKK